MEVQTLSELIDTNPDRNKIWIFRLEEPGSKENIISASAPNFYSITLLRGNNLICYADKSIKILGSTLLFSNPQTPYSLKSFPGNSPGFLCLFSSSFFSEPVAANLNALPLYAQPYALDEQQDQQLSAIFSRMILELDSDYPYKYDLLRTYLLEITHVALKFLSA